MRRQRDRSEADTAAVVPNYRHSPLGTRIPLTALIHALAVGEHLNFRHAATALGVSQSSVSERIRSLEETLGIKLFERWHRGVQPTEAGRLFLANVTEGIEQLDYAIRMAATIGNGQLGRVRIGVSTTIAAGFLADLLRSYRERWPNIEIEIFDGRARDVVLRVREGRLDVAFVPGRLCVPDCHSRELWTEMLFAALPASDARARDDAIHWRDMADDLFLVRCDGTGPQVLDHIIRRFGEQGLRPRIQRCNVGRDILLSTIAQGYGVTICGESTKLIPFDGVAFLRLHDEPRPVSFSAVWSPHNTNQTLRDLLNLAQTRRAI